MAEKPEKSGGEAMFFYRLDEEDIAEGNGSPRRIRIDIGMVSLRLDGNETMLEPVSFFSTCFCSMPIKEHRDKKPM